MSLRASTRAAYARSKCGQLYLELGDSQAAAEAFELVKKDCGGESTNLAEFYIGYAYAVAGFDSAACSHLQIAFETDDSIEQRSSWITTMRTDPEFNQQKSIPGVLALLERYESAQ